MEASAPASQETAWGQAPEFHDISSTVRNIRRQAPPEHQDPEKGPFPNCLKTLSTLVQVIESRHVQSKGGCVKHIRVDPSLQVQPLQHHHRQSGEPKQVNRAVKCSFSRQRSDLLAQVAHLQSNCTSSALKGSFFSPGLSWLNHLHDRQQSCRSWE